MSTQIWTAIACVALAACGAESTAPGDGEGGGQGLQWASTPGSGQDGTSGTTTDAAGTPGDTTSIPTPDPCETGQTKPCLCEDGSMGLQLCEGGADALCDCAACPGAEPMTSSGFLVTSTGQYLFEHGQVLLTHRTGPPSGGGGCVVSATVNLASGPPESPGCALSFEASGNASPQGALPITSLRFEADGQCIGLPESDHGTYTVTEFIQGELLVTPDTVGGGADAECWAGQVTAHLEALMTREDGHPMTLSVSEIQASGSGLSTGHDVLCPGVEVPVDLNDCEKEVPLFADCNPYCQLGCDPDEHCVVDAAFFTCHPVGTLPFGAVCTYPAACGPGLSCFPLPNSDIPQCHMPCVDDDDCPGDAQCAITANLGGGSDLSLCATPHDECDALSQSGCEAGETCYLDGASMLCMPGGGLAAGEFCEDQPANACAPGLHCLVVCRALCSTTTESPSCLACPGGHHEFSLGMGLGFCLDGGAPALCDLYSQSGCASGEGCYPVPGGIACRDAGEITPGLPCTSGDSCTPGYACVSGQCRLLCDLLADDAAATSCGARCPWFSTPDGQSHLSVGAIEPISWGMGACEDL